MPPVTQYVFAEMRRKSGHFTAGSHEWLPYSIILVFLIILNGHYNCQFSIVNCQFGEAAKQQFTGARGGYPSAVQSLGEMPYWALKAR